MDVMMAFRRERIIVGYGRGTVMGSEADLAAAW